MKCLICQPATNGAEFYICDDCYSRMVSGLTTEIVNEDDDADSLDTWLLASMERTKRANE